MRRLVVYLLCVFIAFTLGYTYLHPTLMLLVKWFTPIVGYSFIGLIVSAYLLVADPLKNQLLIIWLLVGFLSGLVVGKRLRGVSTALSVYSTISIILLFSGLDFMRRIREMGLPEEALYRLSPPPSGLTIAHLMEAPVIGDLIEGLMDLLGGGAPTSIESIPQFIPKLVMRMLAPILIVSAENMAALIASSLIGAEVGKLIEGYFSPLSNSLRGWLKGGRVCVVVPFLLTPMTSGLPPSQGPDAPYLEAVIGMADGEGGGYVMALFADPSLSPFGVDPQSPEVEGLLYAFLITHEDGLLPASRVFGVLDLALPPLSLGRLSPPTLLLVAYLDVSMREAGDRASAIASTISSTLGIGLNPMMSTESIYDGGRICSFIYISTSGLEELSEDHLYLISSAGGEVAEEICGAFSRGNLRPHALEGSPDGVLLLAGLIDSEMFDEYVSLGRFEELGLSSLIIPRDVGLVGVSGVLAYWRRGVHSPPRLHTLDLGGLLGVEGLRFSPEAGVSRLLLTFLGSDEEAPIGKLLTTLEAEDIPEWLNSTLLSRGAFLDASDLRLLFEADIPPYVEVVRGVSPMDGEVVVEIEVLNRGESPISDVRISDDPGAYYPESLMVLGSTEDSWSYIGPNGSRGITYRLRPIVGGIYILKPAIATFKFDDLEAASASDFTEVEAPLPPSHLILWRVAEALWLSISDLLNPLTGGFGTPILQVITFTIIALIALREILSIRRWVEGDKEGDNCH